MRVTLVAINAMYLHTGLAGRLLHTAARTVAGVDHALVELHINQPFEAQLSTVMSTAPDALAIGCYIWNMPQVLRLLRAVKAARPDIRVLLGGPEVSYDAPECLSAHAEVDAILCGEAERSYPALLAAWARGEAEPDVAGLVTRTGERPSTPPLPPASWADPYAGAALDPHRIWYAETSRGCPFRCQFCLSSVSPGVRALSAVAAVSRLVGMAKQGARLVKLVDRTFNYDSARARAIWQGLLDADVDCVFHFEIEAHLLDEASLALLQSAPKGKFQFEIGVQTIDSEVLDAIQRGDHFADIASAVRRLKAAGNIPLHLDLIAGLPGETWDSFGRAFDAVHALEPDMLQLGFLKLLKGSGLRRDAARLGIAYAPDPPYQVLRTPTLSFGELDALRDVETLLNWYGNSGRYPATLRALIGEGSAFAAYAALARTYRGGGVLDAARDERQRIAALWTHGRALHGVDARQLADALRLDTLCAGHLPEQLPPDIVPVMDDAQREQDAALLRQLVPDSGVRRSCLIARFGFDVLTWRDGGAAGQTPVRLLVNRKTGTAEKI